MQQIKQIDFIPVGKKYRNAAVLFVGHEACEPAHSFGPHIRDYYLVHYVRSGCGTLYDKRGAHSVREGDIFLIRPHELTTYTADKDNPWEYIWLAFDGIDDDDLCALPSVMPYPYATFLSIMEGLDKKREYTFFASRLYSFFNHLFEDKRTSPCPEMLLHEYVELQYMHPFSMESISRRYGFDRSYLGRLFKRRYGKSPREHLIDVRLSHAKSFLALGHSVTESAAMCGYADLYQFSKLFKAHVGITPIEYQRKVAK